jgi:hypothetical protein
MAARELDFDDQSSEELDVEYEQEVVDPLPPWRVERTSAEHARELQWQYELSAAHATAQIAHLRDYALYREPRFPYYARLYPPRLPGYEHLTWFYEPLEVMQERPDFTPEDVGAKILRRAQKRRRAAEVEREEQFIDPDEEPDPAPEDEAIEEQIEEYFNR